MVLFFLKHKFDTFKPIIHENKTKKNGGEKNGVYMTNTKRKLTLRLVNLIEDTSQVVFL